MSTGGRKDSPKPSPPKGDSLPSSSDEDLLTSEDLFGDLVDAPAEPEPARQAPAARKGPIRVQVSEPGEGKAPKETSRSGEILPEDVAALLDAFSGPGEEAMRAEEAAKAAAPAPAVALQAAPAPRPPAPAPAPVRAVASPAPAATLQAAPGPRPPAPALAVAPPAEEVLETLEELAEPPGGAPDTDLLIDGLVEPTPPAPPPAAPPAPPAAAPAPVEPPVPPPAPELPPARPGIPGLQDLPMGELTPAPPWSAAKAAKPAFSSSATVPGLSLDALLDLPEVRKAIAARAEPPPSSVPPPASRVGTKFQALQPDSKPVEERLALDLAAVAEDAFTAAQPKPEPRPEALRGEQVYGPYRLLEKVAVGGMAEVFKAKRSGVEGFEKVLAVKRILSHLSDNKEFVDMFIDEAKMVAGLTHPNIVQIYDLGKIEKTYYIAMEYVHGRDLRSIMKRGKDRGLRIPLDLSVLVVGEVCAALEYAHRAKDDRGRSMKLVHRDVSPQNILISFEGDAKLTDFGIAKAATKASTTERGALRGKLLYMSPEQAWGKPMDRRSDLFSLGIVLYEMITDQKPFLAGSEMSILEMVRECRVTPPTSLNPRIPETLEHVVMKALQRDPDQRYQDATEMSRDLERALPDRKAPTGAELAKFMEVIFDREERGTPVHDDHASGEHRPGTGNHLEVELEATPARPTPARPQPAPAQVGKTADMSIDKLLKRFGIK